MLSVAATAAAGLITIPSAGAASHAYGVGDVSGEVIGWQGSMRTTGGAYVFCTDPGTRFPAGGDSRTGYRSTWKGVEGDPLAGVNRALHEIDDTNDRDAAALNFVIKHVFDPRAMYRTHGYPRAGSWPEGDLARYIQWVLSTTYPTAGGGWRAVRDRALQLLEVVESTRAATASPQKGTGRLVFTTLAGDPSRGTVTMTGTPGAVGSVTLTNGVFADTGEKRRANVKEGVSYAVRAVPTSDGAPYTVSGTGEFRTGGTAGYRAEVELWTNPTQNMVAKGRIVRPTVFTVVGADTKPRIATFAPVLTSRAAAFAEGGALRDTLTFSVAAVDGVKNPWPTEGGRHREVGFIVTAYGPYAEPPAEVTAVPEGSPVAGAARIVAVGPEHPVTATIPGVEEGGYYTFVAAYDPASTPEATRRFLPADYAWQHAFGMPEETTVAPMRLRLSSQVQEADVALRGRGDDVVIVESDGPWLRTRDGAKNVPVVLTGEYIHLPASSLPAEPVHSLPEGASVVGTVSLTVTEPGRYHAKDADGFGALAVPPGATGHMTWRWSVVEEEQPADHRGFVRGSSELVGEPTQTQTIAVPSIRTRAQPSVRPGRSMTDTAIVSGVVPEGGMALSFAAYSVPFGADGSPAWAGEQGDFSGFCTPENLVWDNHANPQIITEPGTYTSPSVPTDAHSLTLWVERGSAPGSDGRPETIVEGVCGAPEETTYGLRVTTQAQAGESSARVRPGGELWDTVLLTGALPDGGAVSVDLYRWADDAPVCTAESRVWSSEPVPLVGGMFRGGVLVDFRERGQTFTVPELPEGTRLGLVETTRDAEGRVLSRGRCGEEGETVTVVRPAVSSAHALPETGADRDLSTPTIGAAALITAGGLLTVLAIRRRRRHSSDAASAIG